MSWLSLRVRREHERRSDLPASVVLIETTCWSAVRDLLVCCAPPDATRPKIPLQSPKCVRAATSQPTGVPQKGKIGRSGTAATAMRSSCDETRPRLCAPAVSGVCGKLARGAGLLRERRWLLRLRA